VIEKDPNASVGTVWVGKPTPNQSTERVGPGRRKIDRHRIPEELWSEARGEAEAEGLTTAEVVVRAVKTHLQQKKKTKKKPRGKRAAD
jgi:hypothetical protein